jgi:hypothetical protein
VSMGQHESIPCYVRTSAPQALANTPRGGNGPAPVSRLAAAARRDYPNPGGDLAQPRLGPDVEVCRPEPVQGEQDIGDQEVRSTPEDDVQSSSGTGSGSRNPWTIPGGPHSLISSWGLDWDWESPLPNRGARS